MAIFRVEKNKDFTIMSNHHLRNKSLSLKAKGLQSLLLSLPDIWEYSQKGLAKLCKDGVDSISTTLQELEEHSYLTRRQIRDGKGKYLDMEYTIHELPVTTVGNPVDNSYPEPDNSDTNNPKPENPETGEPESEEQTQLSINKQNKNTNLLTTHQSITSDGNNFPQANMNDKIDEIDSYLCLSIEKFSIGHPKSCALASLKNDYRKPSCGGC